MSADHISDFARLEELGRRFDKAAFDFPNVDAVVVSRPDLRLELPQRQAREYLGQVARAQPADASDPDSQLAAEFGQSAKCAYEAARMAAELDWWIPPSRESIEQLGGRLYWAHGDRGYVEDESGAPADCQLWQCTLFGPPARDLTNTALRLFNHLAPDAASLILQGNWMGDKPQSGWLIYLANRREPLVVGSRRLFLHWSTFCGAPQRPMWIPVTDLNPPTKWWAARLPNVFLLSRVVIEQAINLAARAPAPTTADNGAAETTAPGGAERQQEESPSRGTDAETVLPALLSASALASRLQPPQPVDRVESFLRTFRKSHADCYVTVNSRRTNEPQYLYRTAAVWPALQERLPRWQTLGCRETR
jgi:hypothetical protein